MEVTLRKSVRAFSRTTIDPGAMDTVFNVLVIRNDSSDSSSEARYAPGNVRFSKLVV